MQAFVVRNWKKIILAVAVAVGFYVAGPAGVTYVLSLLSGVLG